MQVYYVVGWTPRGKPNMNMTFFHSKVRASLEPSRRFSFWGAHNFEVRFLALISNRIGYCGFRVKGHRSKKIIYDNIQPSIIASECWYRAPSLSPKRLNELVINQVAGVRMNLNPQPTAPTHHASTRVALIVLYG